MRRFQSLLLLGLILCTSRAACGAEKAEAFLQDLRDRGLDELALAYVERMETSPLADDAFRRRIPYYRGVLLIEQSRKTLDKAERSALLDKAHDALVAFA